MTTAGDQPTAHGVGDAISYLLSHEDLLLDLRTSVLAHAEHEELEEFPAIRDAGGRT